MSRNSWHRLIGNEKIWVGVLVGLVWMYWMVWRVVVPGFFLNDDNGNYFLGAYSHNYRSVVEFGEVPMINFHQQLGTRHLGQGQSGVFFPLLYVCFWLAELVMGNRLWGIDLLVLFCWWLGTLGMWGFLRWQKIDRRMAFLASCLYLTFPMVTGVSRSWVVIAYLFAYVPWGFWSLLKLMESFGWKTALWSIVVHLLLLSTGYVQWVVVMAIMEMLFALITSYQGKKEKLSKLVLYRILGLGLNWVLVVLMGAVLLLPMWHSRNLSTVRIEGMTITELLRNRVRVVDFLLGQIGVFTDDYFFNGSSYVVFVGPLLLLLWVGVWRKSSELKNKNYWRRLCWFSMGVGWLTTVVYGLVFYIPILNQFRWPFKYLVIFEFFLVWVLVLGLGDKGIKMKWRKLGIWIMGVSLVMNVAVMWIHRQVDNAFSEYVINLPYEPKWDEVVGRDGRMVAIGVDPFDWRANIDLGSFNLASVLGYFQFGGYDAAPAIRVLEATQFIPAWGATMTDISSDQVKYMESWGVKYWLTKNKKAAMGLVAENEQMDLEQLDGGVIVVKDKKALPLVYDVVSGEKVDYQTRVNQVVVQPKSTHPIVLNVLYWPGYGVDQGKIQVSEYKGRVLLHGFEAGKTLRITYRDKDFEKGLWVSGLGIVCTAVYLWRLKTVLSIGNWESMLNIC